MNLAGTTFNSAFQGFSLYEQARGGESTYETERAEKREMNRDERRIENQQLEESREMEMKEMEMKERDMQEALFQQNNGFGLDLAA